jgi:hypothetical protein
MLGNDLFRRIVGIREGPGHGMKMYLRPPQGDNRRVSEDWLEKVSTFDSSSGAAAGIAK